MDQAQLVLEIEKMREQREQWNEDHEQRWHQWEKNYRQRMFFWILANAIAATAIAIKLYAG